MKKRSLAKLKKDIWKLQSEYTKKKQQDWRGYGTCISCSVYRPIEELQAGHFYSRVSDFTTGLLVCEENVNVQCVPDNYYKRGNPQGYAVGLVRKYGVDILGKLEKAKKTPKRYSYKDLLKIEEELKEKIKEL